MWFRHHAVGREILLAFGSVLVCLIAAEAAVRVFDPFGISYFRESWKYTLDKLPDPVLVFKHTPGLQRTYQNVRVVINELGLRDRELEAKPDGELRILLLGDSVTFGWGVTIEGTFGRRLESALASELGRPVRTVNAGVGGYNTVQEWAALRTHADALDPDLVLLLYVANDIEPNDPPFDPRSETSLRGKAPSQAIGILLWKSWLYRLGRFAFHYARSSGPASLEPNARGVRESMEALSSMAVFCKDRGARFVTFFYRPNGDPMRELSSALLAEVQAIGRAQGFPVADTGSWWADVDMRSVTNSRIDPHPNARGHEILAAGMADFLTSHGLVDKAPTATK